MDRLKLFGICAGAALVLVLLWAVSPLLVGWPLCLYVLWRAGPSVGADVRRTYARFFPANSWRM